MLRIPILYGGAFDEQDRRDTPRVAVINETMARQYFGGVNAVGRRFRFEADTDGWIEVVGVVRDTGTADLQGDLVDPTPQLWKSTPKTASKRPTTDGGVTLVRGLARPRRPCQLVTVVLTSVERSDRRSAAARDRSPPAARAAR